MAGTLGLIKSLPPELREQILKEYIKIKVKEKEELGWKVIKKIINNAPFCEYSQQIVRVYYCYKCDEDFNMNDYICYPCLKKEKSHIIKSFYIKNDVGKYFTYLCP